MTFPTATVSTTNLDSATDDPSLARADLLDAVQKLNTIIDEGGDPNGVALLNGSGYIPTTQIPPTISTTAADITLAPSTGIVNIQNILRLTQFPRATILAFTANVSGDMVMCSNVGNIAATPGIAFYNGTAWRGLPFTANVFVNL
jgi:hypothetical protein